MRADGCTCGSVPMEVAHLPGCTVRPMLTRAEVEAIIRSESEPTMVEIKDGWAAVGEGWAVFATLERDARFKFAEAVKLHREIAARPR